MNKDPFENTSIGFLEDHDVDENGIITISAMNPTIIFFCMVFADWCGPCKMTKPEYAEFSRLLNLAKIENVRLLGINATNIRKNISQLDPREKSETALAKRLDMWQSNGRPIVTGFPTILLVMNGQIMGRAMGERNVMSFIENVSKVAEKTQHPDHHHAVKKLKENYKEITQRV